MLFTCKQLIPTSFRLKCKIKSSKVFLWKLENKQQCYKVLLLKSISKEIVKEIHKLFEKRLLAL